MRQRQRMDEGRKNDDVLESAHNGGFSVGVRLAQRILALELTLC
jgi:hypothetical protein